MYAIVYWMDVRDMGFAMNEDGSTMLFDNFKDAVQFVKENLNGSFRIIDL